MPRIVKYAAAALLLLGAVAAGIMLEGPRLTFVAAKSSHPEQVVRDYYRWYLDYVAPDFGGDVHNPLVEHAYQISPFLTGDLINRIDGIVENGMEIHYDPFFCAQDVPAEIQVIASFQTDQQAAVVVETSFYQHIFTVDLVNSRGQWKIANVDCGTSPSAVTAAFYGWYLDYLGDRELGDLKNPLVDQAYRSSQLLSGRLISAVDQALDGMETAGFDPFLMAQDIPTSYRVEVGPGENSAFIYLTFGPDYEKILQVEMFEENGRLVIDRIIEVKP